MSGWLTCGNAGSAAVAEPDPPACRISSVGTTASKEAPLPSLACDSLLNNSEHQTNLVLSLHQSRTGKRNQTFHKTLEN